jgi:putative transposase
MSFWKTICIWSLQRKTLATKLAHSSLSLPEKIIDYLVDQKVELFLKQLRFLKKRHKADRDFQLWQEGSHPQQILSDEMMLQKLEYIHMNPVKRGFVDEAEHWRYSSARNYLGKAGLIEVATSWQD